MNTVGKIFSWLVLISSLVFSAWAVQVYATHKNWRDLVENPQTGYKAQIEKKKQELEELEKKREELATQMAEEITKKKKALADLASYKEKSDLSVKELTEKRDALDKQQQEAVAAMTAAQQNLDRLTKEVEGLRQEIRVTQGDRDKQFAQVVKLTDELNEAVNVKKRLDERALQLAKQIADARVVIFKNGLTENPSDIPPPLRGKVLAVSQNDLLEVSLGSDDGIRPGNTLEVFRGSSYLGRVQVLETKSDRAVAKILPDYKKGIIQKDDDVATRFKLG